MLAAGTAGTLDEGRGVFDLAHAGALVTKSITREPRTGNPAWRVWPLDVGMLNAIGLANPGIDAFLSEWAPRAGGLGLPVIGSVAGTSVDDYVHVAAALDASGRFGAIELNVSCPNVHGGTEFGTNSEALSELVREVRAVCGQSRLIVKMTPVLSGSPSMTDLARACIEPAGGAPNGPNQRPGADILTISNTVPALGIDPDTRAPVLGNGTGGLSGPAVHPIALKLVHDVSAGIARDTGTPLIGLGGVTGWKQAASFILAGASAVGLGTVLFADPRAPRGVARGLERWLHRQGEARISALVGALKQP